MIHHYSRYEDLDYHHLKSELERERRNREHVEITNADLERSITELEGLMLELEKNTRVADDNEWKIRFEATNASNKQFQEYKEFLESELAETRRRLTTGTYPDALNFNLDALNEPELLRLVKHLERLRNDFYSTLRDTEWKLDKQSKEFHHFDEMRTAYKNDLKQANAAIVKLGLGHVVDTRAIPPMAIPPPMPNSMPMPMSMSMPMPMTMPPPHHHPHHHMMFPPGSDELSPPDLEGMHISSNFGGNPNPMGGNGAGKKGQKKGGGGGGMTAGRMKNESKTGHVHGGGCPGGGHDSMNASPTRSKSRGDKKSKKKDAGQCQSNFYMM